LALDTDGTTITLGFPAGFNVFTEVEVTLDGQTISCGWKRLTAADSGSYTITSDSALDWVCQAAAFSGRDGQLPPVISANATSNSANASPVSVTANGVTAVTGDDLCWIGALDRSIDGGTVTFAPPTDYTERQDTLNGWSAQSIATRDNVSAGATGSITGTATLSTGTAGWASWLVRIPVDDGITQPSLVEAGALSANAAGTTITSTIPASAATDDIMVLALMCNGSTTFSTPTDWTLLGTSIESNANQSTEWFWKRHDGSESDPVSTTSATMSGTVGGYGRVYVFRGCTTSGDPFEDVTMAGSPTTDNNPDTAAIDTTGTWRLAVSLLMVDDDNTWSSGNPPSGWSAIGRVSSTTGGDCMMDGLTQLVPTASTVAAATIGTMSAADYWRSITFGLIPATASGDATVTATTVAATTAIPAPTIQTGSTVTAVAVSRSVVIPAPTVSGNATVTATAVSRAAVVPAPTLQTGSTVAATAVSRAAAVPAPTIQTGSTVAALSVAAVAAVPAPTVSTAGNATINATTVAAVALVSAPTVSGGATVAAVSVAAVVGLPAPTVSGNTTVTAVTVGTVASVPAPTIQTGSTVTAVAVSQAVTIPAPTVTAGGNVTINATSVAAVASVPAPTVQTGVTVTAAAVSAPAAIPAPTVSGGATVTAIAVSRAVTIPAPTVTAGGNVTIAAVTVAAVVVVPVPTVSTGQRVNPPTVNTTAVIPAPTVSGNAAIIAVAVTATVSIPAPSVRTGSTIAAATVAAMVAIITPFIPEQVLYGTGMARGATTSAGMASGSSTGGIAGSTTIGGGQAGRG
jgi:hypothetical protein